MTIRRKRSILSFSQKLFLSVILLFWVFVGIFAAYQYHREKRFKIELLNSQLQDFNILFATQTLHDSSERNVFVKDYSLTHHIKNLRVTLMRTDGTVLYDNDEKDVSKMGNHHNRREVKLALKNGTGYDINRASATLGGNYFYSATHFPEKDYIVRSALPYTLDLAQYLRADSSYLWLALLLTLVLTLIFFQLTSRLGHTITQLRTFAEKADHDEPFEADEMKNLSGNELGDISHHIVDIYKRLRHTRDDLFIEREKLILHLQLSHEGLAIFKPDKDVILANSYFTQYSNLISDTNLAATEDVFKIAELSPLAEFITAMLADYTSSKEKRKAITIDKNGRIFVVEAIVFADNTFEISINDITQQEEQARLKRQITQNVAHELKTPVSSIQGYLETILNTPNLPPDKLALFLERSYAQSNRLTNLLSDISALTRMDEGSSVIERTPLDVAQIIRTLQQELALQLDERQMSVTTNVPAAMPLVGNASLIYSIFRNLMDNALAYAGTGTAIRIACFREDAEFYYFSVADNGVGVPDEHLGRLFERFYRVDKGRSRKMGGTGLGLAIVKNAVLFHGGNINAKHAQGGGLEFVFSLRKK